MTPISRVCSATSVLIVFEIKTTAESSARIVITLRRSANFCVSAFPGQSPGARTFGRSEKPANPGTVPRKRRTALTVRWAALGRWSRSRSASSS